MTLARWKVRLSGWVPVFTVVGTLGVMAVFVYGDDHRRAVIGYAQGLPEAVSPLEPAKVASVEVAVGQLVEPGQVLARLDASLVDAEISVAEAEKVRLEASVTAERALVDRRLEADVFLLEREAAREREEQLRLDSETRALDAEIVRVRGLVAEKHALAADLSALELRRASTAALAAQKPKTLDVFKKQMGRANQRQDDTAGAATATTAKLEAELLVVRRRIELLERRRAGLTLKATRKGRIASIDRRAGETASAGDAVVRIVSATDRVIACVPERMALGLREGDVARLWVKGQRGTPLHGKTVALGPVVSELPARCWFTPHVPVWGREITIALDTPIDVVAGESFEVAIDPGPSRAATGATTTIASGVISAPAPTEPRLMSVPTSLLARSRFEPSALLAVPGEKRYLVVSDDTGWDGRDAGKPWLFGMDASGAVAAEPIPIAGVSEIDDLESIAEGEGGDVFVLASQSFSKKGKRKPARTAMLRLRKDGSGYRAEGETPLATRLEAALGLAPGARDLDVEGMTFRSGALYLGVKAPLDAQGNARIVKVTNPRALFGEGDPGLAVWATVHLEVEVAGAKVPGGISELLFQPDGALVLASTPSTAEGEAGALWVVPQPGSGGAFSAKLAKAFPRHKPEGLAPALSGSGLVVVFDAGQRTPSLLELPWLSP